MGTKLKVGKFGIEQKVDEKSLEAIKNLPIPSSEKNLRTFTGMVNFIEKFIPNAQLELGPFYQIISSLSKTPNSKFSDFWTEKHTELFENVKNLIPKCLGIPDYSKPFKIEVDSSERGHGAMLYQKNKICAFASKNLRGPGKNKFVNAERETAGVIFALEKFRKFIAGSPFPVEVETDCSVSAFIKSAHSPKLQRWKIAMDEYNVKLVKKSGPTMFVSDALSRLFPIENKLPQTEQMDKSEQLLEEFPIGQVQVDSNDYKILEAFQIHCEKKHVGIDRLVTISGFPRQICKTAVDFCATCAANKPLKVQKQILGTLEDPKEKNGHWYIDIVFKNQKNPYLSTLDRSTRYMFIKKLPSATHKNVTNVLQWMFATYGKPKQIFYDQAFLSGKNTSFFDEFLAKNKILHFPRARHNPETLAVERFHQEFKKIARINNCSYEEAVAALNELPFTNVPKGSNLRKITPKYLYENNDQKTITAICDCLLQLSKQRKLRSEKLRNKNISKYMRDFCSGDLVRFQMGNKIDFGKVLSKKGKIYTIENIFTGKKSVIHAKELEKVLISENTLRILHH